jgi:basic amino acid/polyamine antiporter, APA family
VLRSQPAETDDPYRVPLYPLLPALFVAVCAYMLWSSLSYVHSQTLGGFNAAWIGVAVLGFGAVLLLLMRSDGPAPPQPAKSRA